MITDEFLDTLADRIADRISGRIPDHPVTEPKRYFNKGDACQYLGVSRNTLEKFMRVGLAYSKIGGVFRFSREDLDAFVYKYRREATQ